MYSRSATLGGGRGQQHQSLSVHGHEWCYRHTEVPLCTVLSTQPYATENTHTPPPPPLCPPPHCPHTRKLTLHLPGTAPPSPTCMACAGPILRELLATLRSSTVLRPGGRGLRSSLVEREVTLRAPASRTAAANSAPTSWSNTRPRSHSRLRRSPACRYAETNMQQGQQQQKEK